MKKRKLPDHPPVAHIAYLTTINDDLAELSGPESDIVGNVQALMVGMINLEAFLRETLEPGLLHESRHVHHRCLGIDLVDLQMVSREGSLRRSQLGRANRAHASPGLAVHSFAIAHCVDVLHASVHHEHPWEPVFYSMLAVRAAIEHPG